MPLYDLQATLIAQEWITDSIVQLSFAAPQISQAAGPGQFVMLKAGEGRDPLLRRPFSIHGTTADGTVQILLRVVGKGTRLLSSLLPGASVPMLGPLGNGFDLSRIDARTSLLAVVGGGMGVAPLLYVADRLAQQGLTGKTQIILGARYQRELLCLLGFKKLGFAVQCITDDGSSGEQGFVSDLLRRNLTNHTNAIVFTCGPVPMLKAVSLLCEQFEAECQVSLETYMACGISACLGCAVPANNAEKEYVHVCKNGPVFNSREIAWNLL